MIKANLLLFLIVALPAICISQAKNNFNLEYFLKQYYDFSSLPAYEEKTYCSEVSTYDRGGLNNDGFSGTYSFIRRNADSTLVIFEQKGPGVINRFWTPTPTNDTLDFYIDDTLHKSFSICYMDLYSGKVYPFVAPLCANQLGGFYCYLPIPFNKFCKIVLKGKKTMFHQIGYKLYPDKAQVKSFSLSLNENEKQALDKIKTGWSDPLSAIKNTEASVVQSTKQFLLKPGGTITIFESDKPGRIIGFELISQSTLDTIAKNIDLRITWDNDKEPAVYCPVADYFGYAFGKASMAGLMVGCDGKRHYSWFPMPYDRSARIELMYRKTKDDNSSNDVALFMKVYFQNKKRDASTEGEFYAAWNREDPVPTGKPFEMLDVKGKGHFAGVVLQAQGLRPGITEFFEGDDSTVIDGELRFHGTGSEDFFNGGWYALLDRWEDGMSLPLSGALDYSIPLSRTGGYRFFLSDKMSFNNALLQTIEHGPQHNLFPSDYTSVSYYYCDRNNLQKIMPANNNTHIYVPDTLEIYPQLTPSTIDENIAVVAKWQDSPAKTMFYTVSNETLLKLYLQDVPAGTYAVYLDYGKDNDAAEFSLWQRQTQVSDWMDAYAASNQKIKMFKAGVIYITEMNNTISFRFKTVDQRNKFTLAKIVLVKNK
jgi:hypothetical protein